MKTSTEIASIAKLVGEERAIELVAKAGFSAWDFSMFTMWSWDWTGKKPIIDPHPLNGREYLAFARKLKQIGLDNGIVCNQSHAPFPSLYCGDEWLLRAIECTAEAGGDVCVIHPDNCLSAEKNAEMYFRLLPFAKQCGVRIATENMWNWNNAENCAAPAACSDPESFLAHLDAVNDDAFVACLDIGHAEMRGLGTSAPEMIRALGPRLAALHIHDNNLWKDSHQIPYSMQIDFDEVAKALREINYEGYYTLEADSFLRGAPAEKAEEGVIALRRSLDRMA